MSKIILNDVGSFNTGTLATINTNNATLETALDNTLSRNGTSPNQMEATLDMNSNPIINLPAPDLPNSPLRLKDLDTFIDTGGSSILTIAAGDNISIVGELPSVISAVGLEPHSNILTSITGKGTNPGYISVLGDGTVNTRTFTASGGLSVSQGNGVLGDTEYTIDVPTARTALSINNIDNTTDLNKPVSTATTAAIATAVTTVTGNQREKLTANRTYFVATTGNNSNNGLAVGTPFLTLQYAWDLICDTLDLRGFTVTIQLANGTYTSGLATNKGTVGGNGASSVKILGNATPANVIISTTSADCFGIGTLLFGNSQFTIGGIKLQTTTAGNCINVSGGGSCVVFGTGGFPVEFGTCAQSHVVGNHGCSLFAGGAGNRVVGGAVVHGSSLSNATVAFHGVPIIFVGAANSLSFPSGFWNCEGNGTLYVGNKTDTNGAAVNVASPSGLVASGGKIINYPLTSTLVGSGVVTEIGLGKYLATGLENVKIDDVTGLGTGVSTFLITPSSANLKTAVTDETGSGSLVFATSPTLTTPNTVGTVTNNDAAAGSVGEYVSAVGTLSSVTISTAANMTSISLTAGDWDVSWLVQSVANNASTNVVSITGSVSTTSATHSFTVGDYANMWFGSAGTVPGSGNALIVPGIPKRFSLASTTTIYLIGSCNFTVSTNQMNGFIRARRVR